MKPAARAPRGSRLGPPAVAADRRGRARSRRRSRGQGRRRAAAAGVGAREALERAVGEPRREAGPVVAHRDPDRAARVLALSSIRPPPCAPRCRQVPDAPGGAAARSAGTVGRAARRRGSSPAGRRLARRRRRAARARRRLARDRQLALVGAREHEQVLGERDQPVGLLAGGRQRRAQLLRAALALQRDVDLRLEDRQRRAQLVARVGDEAALLRDAARSARPRRRSQRREPLRDRPATP